LVEQGILCQYIDSKNNISNTIYFDNKPQYTGNIDTTAQPYCKRQKDGPTDKNYKFPG
jgi:hypothetical protein